MSRRVIVEYDFNRDEGDCVVLTVLNGDPDERFAIPFAQADAVADAIVRLAHEEEAT